MPIYPLPQFEADLQELEEADRKVYEALKPPSTIVVRFGRMKMVGEFPYDGSAKPGCGSKLVVRTFRGTEIGEMLTSTCPNSGCSKSVSRKEMLEYIENSGGRDYPFSTDGRVLRIATADDLERQSRLEQSANALRIEARRIVEEMALPMKIVEAEPILGGERLTFHYMSEERIEHRDLARRLGAAFSARIDLRQVGARDEARLVADYEKCGQYCCCKNFLKVLKPISMKSAKVQKATLDPLKISGRCGRLMCCLRYEDQTYAELAAKLPRKKSRVGTPEGDGIVVDSQILTQLVLVSLDADGKRIAVAVEDLTPPTGEAPREPAPSRPGAPRPAAASLGGGPRPEPRERRDNPPRPGRDRRPAGEGPRPTAGAPARPPAAERPAIAKPETGGEPAGPASADGARKRRRRRKRRGGPPGSGGQGAGGPSGGENGPA